MDEPGKKKEEVANKGEEEEEEEEEEVEKGKEELEEPAVEKLEPPPRRRRSSIVGLWHDVVASLGISRRTPDVQNTTSANLQKDEEYTATKVPATAEGFVIEDPLKEADKIEAPEKEVIMAGANLPSPTHSASESKKESENEALASKMKMILAAKKSGKNTEFLEKLISDMETGQNAEEQKRNRAGRV